tara:strand:- start:1108 stop:1248 length:141 start_codon:yes stop_codon:yes gene_type:complete
MFPFAGLTLKSIKNMDQKIGWRAALFAYFLRLLVKSQLSRGTRFEK